MILEPGGQAPRTTANEKATGTLPPLGPPKVIEDLLAREIGIPASELNRAPDPVINGGTNWGGAN